MILQKSINGRSKRSTAPLLVTHLQILSKFHLKLWIISLCQEGHWQAELFLEFSISPFIYFMRTSLFMATCRWYSTFQQRLTKIKSSLSLTGDWCQLLLSVLLIRLEDSLSMRVCIMEVMFMISHGFWRVLKRTSCSSLRSDFRSKMLSTNNRITSSTSIIIKSRERTPIFLMRENRRKGEATRIKTTTLRNFLDKELASL